MGNTDTNVCFLLGSYQFMYHTASSSVNFSGVYVIRSLWECVGTRRRITLEVNQEVKRWKMGENVLVLRARRSVIIGLKGASSLHLVTSSIYVPRSI